MKTLKRFFQERGFIFLCIFLGVAGARLVYHATTWGPWAFSDSAAYISSARNFNLGLGVSIKNANGGLEPLDTFPPVYPLALSLLARFGLDYLSAARWLDIFLFGIFLLMFSLSIHSLSENIWLTLITGLLLLFSPVLIQNFTGAMTEPLFITIFYSAIFSTLLYLKKKKIGWLILAVILTAISPLMRYIGLVTCVVNTLMLLWLNDSTWKEKILKSGVFGFISIVPILSWFGITYRNNQTLGARNFIFSSNLLGKLQTFFSKTASVFQSWVPYAGLHNDWMPDSVKASACLSAVILILLIGGWLHFRQKKKPPFLSNSNAQLIFTAILIISIFMVTLCLIFLFTLPKPDIISRIFSPILPAVILLTVSAAFYLLDHLPKNWNRYVGIFFAVLAFLLVRYFFLITIAQTEERSKNGFGYTAREIQTSGFLQAIQQIPPETPLIANTPAMVLLYTNRMPYPLDFIPTVPLGTRSAEMDRIFVNQKAALILDYASIRNVYPDWQERLAYFTQGLEAAFQDEIGGIYYFPAGSRK